MAELIYDADCAFCTTAAMWLAKRDTFEPRAWQFMDNLAELGLDYQAVTEAAHWVVDGEVVASGSDAIGRALIARGGLAKPLGYFVVNPLVRPFARFAYKRIALHRHLMPGGTAECRVPAVRQES